MIILIYSYYISNIKVENKKLSDIHNYPNKVVTINFKDFQKNLYLENMDLNEIVILKGNPDIHQWIKNYGDGFIDIEINLQGEYTFKVRNKIIVLNNEGILIDNNIFPLQYNEAIFTEKGDIIWGKALIIYN